MKLVELIKGTDIKCILSDPAERDAVLSTEIAGIASDSRQVKDGYLFVCIRGLHTDGHKYIEKALENGAVSVLTEEECLETDKIKREVIYLTSANTRRALSFLFNTWYGRPADGMKLIAVTGTNGKTSVTFMLREIFRAALVKTGLVGTVVCYSDERKLSIRSENENANMTTPDPKELYKILSVMKNDGVEVVLIEATSHALALDKLAPLRFASAIFTNLSPDHLDFHGDMKSYLDAKKKLFTMADSAIINADDASHTEIAETAEKSGCGNIRLCTVREDRHADYAALNVRSLGTSGVEYILSSVSHIFKVSSPIPGRFTVINTLEAAACALEEGISPQNVQDALRHMRGIDGRFERVKLCMGADFSVFIDYAHTPDALENLLLTVRGFRKKGERIVLLFGCGGDRDRSKRPVMGRIASSLADFVIVTSDNSRSEDPQNIISDIMSGFDYSKAGSVVIENRAEAIDYAVKNALESDIILLAGKGHEAYEIDKNGKHPFDEKEIVREAARKYYYYRRHDE